MPYSVAGAGESVQNGLWILSSAFKRTNWIWCILARLLRVCPCALTGDAVRISVPFWGKSHERLLGSAYGGRARRPHRVRRSVNIGSGQRRLRREARPDCRAEDVALLRKRTRISPASPGSVTRRRSGDGIPVGDRARTRRACAPDPNGQRLPLCGPRRLVRGHAPEGGAQLGSARRSALHCDAGIDASSHSALDEQRALTRPQGRVCLLAHLSLACDKRALPRAISAVVMCPRGVLRERRS